MTLGEKIAEKWYPAATGEDHRRIILRRDLAKLIDEELVTVRKDWEIKMNEAQRANAREARVQL